MEFRDVLAALRAGWWLPVVGLLVGAIGAAAISLLSTPLYTSTIKFFVSTTGSDSTSDVLQGSQFSQQRVTSYAELLQGQELSRRVVDRLDLHRTPEQLSSQLTVTAVPETVLIKVSVADPSPRLARQIAETLGDEFTARIDEVEAPDAAGAVPVKVTVAEPPELPDSPSSPATLRNVALGLAAGLALGGAAAVLRGRLDRSVKDVAEAVDLAGAPVMGTIVFDPAMAKQQNTLRGGDHRAAEAYRQLRNNLQFLNVDEPVTAIMVSSALPSEGKTTVVVNLGLALAAAGQKVTIVEADLRRPRVTRYLGMVSGVGLTNILTGSATLDDVVQRYGPDGLSVIAAGPTPPNPGELLASASMASLVQKLRGQNDFVLIDAPPLLPVADSSGLAVHVDGVLLSVRYGRTRKDQLERAVDTVERVGARTLGLILNMVPPRADAVSGYEYDYAPDQPEQGESLR